MDTKNYFRNAAYAAAFVATALFSVGCEDKMTEVEGPLDGISNKNGGSTTTTQTAQSVMIDVVNFKPSEVVDGEKLEFDFETAAQYYSSQPVVADLAKFMDDAAFGKNDKGGPSNQGLKAMICAFWWGKSLPEFTIEVNEKGSKTTYTLTPTTTTSLPKGVAWNSAGSGTTPELNLKINIAGQSVMFKDITRPKYSFTIQESDGTPRVSDLNIFIEKLNANGAVIPSESKVKLLSYLNGDLAVRLGSSTDPFIAFNPFEFMYKIDNVQTDFNVNVFGKSDAAKSILKNGETMAAILGYSDVKNKEAYINSASAYVDVNQQLFADLSEGQYRIRVTGTIKNNEAAIASENFSMTSGTFEIGFLNSCK